jgi:hypothetical protein
MELEGESQRRGGPKEEPPTFRPQTLALVR